MRAVATIAVALAACSIPDVDLSGKQCPCASGYTCTTSNTCVLATDAGVDGASATSCLGSAPGASIYTTEFADASELASWHLNSGAWSIDSGDMLQNDPTATLAYAHHRFGGGNMPADYRVTSQMRMLFGDDGRALEVAVRAQTDQGNNAQYHCNWEPTDGAFLIMRTEANGIDASVLKQITVPPASLPDPMSAVTMEFQVKGTQLSCCLREVAGTLLLVDDGALTSGAPGFKTYRMSGRYAFFHVNAPP